MTVDVSPTSPLSKQAIIRTIAEISEFVRQDAFRSLLDELAATPRDEREDFVRRVVIDADALAARSIRPPAGMVIQRSVFRDGRPTLFCVTKYLPGMTDQKVTVTFDNDLVEQAASDPHRVAQPA